MTPKSYLSFINGYKNIYAEKVKFINEQAERMNIGKRNGMGWNGNRVCLIGISLFCLVDILFENEILTLFVVDNFKGCP